jgi:hypothetical protein
MPISNDSLNKELYRLLRTQGFDPIPKDSKGDTTPVPDEAEVFKFTFKTRNEPVGSAWITVDSNQDLKVYYNDKIFDNVSESDKHEHRADFTDFLKQLKRWAQRRQLGFDLENQDHLASDMARREYMKKQEPINEGYYPINRTTSYNDNIPTIKIVLQHSKQIQEGEQRFRNVSKIFLENTEGERILAPTTRPGIAQIYARHLAEGGMPNDGRWNHIKSLCEEYQKMSGFVRAIKNKQFNESAQGFVDIGLNHYKTLRETLSRMRGQRGYNNYFDNYTPALMETESDDTNINELFIQETIDPRIESVMPILNKLSKKINEMQEVDELRQWTDNITEIFDIGTADRVDSNLKENQKALIENEIMGVPMQRIIQALDEWFDYLNTGESLADTNEQHIEYALDIPSDTQLHNLWQDMQDLPTRQYHEVVRQIELAAMHADPDYDTDDKELMPRDDDDEGDVNIDDIIESKNKEAHQQNMDAAQKEIDRRNAEGEDMTGAEIDPRTYKIIKPKNKNLKEGTAQDAMAAAAAARIAKAKLEKPAVFRKQANFLPSQDKDWMVTPDELTAAGELHGREFQARKLGSNLDESFESAHDTILNDLKRWYYDDLVTALTTNGFDEVMNAIEDVANAHKNDEEYGSSDRHNMCKKVFSYLNIEPTTEEVQQEGIGPEQKRVGQVPGTEKAKTIKGHIGEPNQPHPFQGRLVGANESQENPSSNKNYVCVHAKKGKCEVQASSSYEAAKKAAEKWKLKNTSGIDAYLADKPVDTAQLEEGQEDLDYIRRLIKK